MSDGRYRWSDGKRRFFLNGKEIFVEKYHITYNDRENESIHEIFTVKKKKRDEKE